jgi:hypothetical protein
MAKMEFTKDPDAGAAEAASSQKASDSDIASLRAGGEKLAAMDAAIATLETLRDDLSRRREKMMMEELPTRMMELRVPSVGLPDVTPEQWLRDGAAELARAARILGGESNDPAEIEARQAILDGIKTPDKVVLTLEDWAHANIAADWEPEKKEKALQWLVENGCEGMIKSQLVLQFARGEKKLADKVVAAIRKALGKRADEVSLEISEAVPWNTLTSFVKEEVFEKNNSELPLELLGARVGKRARLAKERKKK